MPFGPWISTTPGCTATLTPFGIGIGFESIGGHYQQCVEPSRSWGWLVERYDADAAGGVTWASQCVSGARSVVRRSSSSADRASSIQSSASRSHAALSKSSVAVLALARHSSDFRRYRSVSSVVMPYHARSADPFQAATPVLVSSARPRRTGRHIPPASLCRRTGRAAYPLW